jgi:hypothetical protein
MPKVVIIKNLPVKGLCDRCFICLRPTSNPCEPILPPFTDCIVYTVLYTYSHRERGEGPER